MRRFDPEVSNHDPHPRTFGDWKKIGYVVVKGEKATGRVASGACTFRHDQVMEIQKCSP